MDEQDGDRLIRLRDLGAGMDEVNGEIFYVRDELRELVDPTLSFSPVIVIPPLFEETLGPLIGETCARSKESTWLAK